jgi:hypothetical protein
MVSIIGMPQFQAGQQGYNFQPLSAGLDTIRDQQNQNKMMQFRKQQMAEQNNQFEQGMDARYAAMDDSREQNNQMMKFRESQAAADSAYKQQMLALQRQKASQEGATSYGKSGAIFQGPDGRHYSIQFGSNGQQSVQPVQFGDTALSPAKGVMAVDEATGTRLVDKATGSDVRQIPKDIAGAETAKKVGANQGELIANKTKATMGASSKLQQGGLVFDAVDKALEAANWTGATGLVGSATKNVPPLEGVWSAPAYTLSKRLDTVKANIGFDKLQDMRDNSPTGGALGQVSTFELEMLQGVWGSVEQAQGRAEIVRNLQNFKRIYRGSMQRIKDAYEMDYGKGSFRGLGMGRSAAAASPGSPATNPSAPAPRQSGVPEHPLLKKYGIE